MLGSPDVDPGVAPVAVPDAAQHELEELLVDEAGNELSAEEVAELRRVRDDREPVVTRSRARDAMSVLTRLGPGLPELVWQRYTSVIPPTVSGEVFLSYCYVAHRSARRGMREVTPERAQSLDFVVAKQKKLASWVACHVYDLVPDNGQKAISCRRVLVDKVQDDGSLKPKARSVVRGFQEAGLRDLNTFSPTCSKSSWRVLLTVASYRGWAPIAVDISTAFLQGGALQRQVYVRWPQELHAPGQLLKLRKAVYGLVDAPLQWYQARHKAMLSLGAIVVPFDLAIYLFWDHENLCGWAAVHVNDISIAGTDSVISSVLEALHSVFSVGSEKREEYVFCGVHLECKRDDDGNLIEITLDQQKYIDEIAEISLEESTDRGRLLNAKETTLHRGLIGALSWCTGQTRPDFSYSVCRLSQRSSKPTVSDALQANKTLQHMRKRSLFIRFPKLSGPVRLIGYHDSSWGNGEEGKTVGGWLWTIASVGEDKKERFCLINWKSRTLRRVVKPTFAGETLACSACLDDLFLTLNVVTEITKMRVPVTLRTHCASLFDHVYLHKAVSEKRLLIELAVIGDAITSGEVTNLECVATQDQLADALTKSGYSSIFYNSLNNAFLP